VPCTIIANRKRSASPARCQIVGYNDWKALLVWVIAGRLPAPGAGYPSRGAAGPDEPTFVATAGCQSMKSEQLTSGRAFC